MKNPIWRGTLLPVDLWAFALAGWVLLLGLPAFAQAAGRQRLSDTLTAPTFSAPRAGEMTGDEKIFLSLGLQSRDPEGLKNFLSEVTDPHSPQYGRYLNKGKFADRFGPSASDYRKVVDFATAHGLTVVNTHSGRTMVYVSGTSAQVQELFHVHLRYYKRKDGSRFFAPEEQPSVELDVPLASIGGLDNYFLPRRARPVKPAKRGKPPVESPQPGPQNWGTGPGGAYWGNDFRKAYAPNVSLNGAG